MGPIILGLLVAFALLVLLAVGAPSAAARRMAAMRARGRGDSPRMSPLAYQRLVRDLLVRGMGFSVESEEVEGGTARLLVKRASPGGLGHVTQAVLVAASPPGEVVDQTQLLELEQTVTALGAAGGMLFTPYAIDHTGLAGTGVELELVDGPRLRHLLAAYLPARLHDLDGFYALDPMRPLTMGRA